MPASQQTITATKSSFIISKLELFLTDELDTLRADKVDAFSSDRSYMEVDTFKTRHFGTSRVQ